MSRYIDAELLIEAMQGRKFANDECVRHGTDSLSKEYYRHLQFEDGIMMGFVREQPTAEVISLDRIKEAREEVSKSCYKACITDDGVIRESKVLEIIDNLIAEVEG